MIIEQFAITFGWWIVLMPFYKKIMRGYDAEPREYFTIVPLTILVYSIYYLTYVFKLLYQHSPNKGGWSPYVFGGMPEFAVGGGGIKYYNHIWVAINFLENLFANIIEINIIVWFCGVVIFLLYRKGGMLSFCLALVIFEIIIIFMEV